MRKNQADKPERDRASMPPMPEGGTGEMVREVGEAKRADWAGRADERARGAPTHDQIRARAHEIYRERCERGETGDEAADWARAERELGGL